MVLWSEQIVLHTPFQIKQSDCYKFRKIRIKVCSKNALILVLTHIPLGKESLKWKDQLPDLR